MRVKKILPLLIGIVALSVGTTYAEDVVLVDDHSWFHMIFHNSTSESFYLQTQWSDHVGRNDFTRTPENHLEIAPFTQIGMLIEDTNDTDYVGATPDYSHLNVTVHHGYDSSDPVVAEYRFGIKGFDNGPKTDDPECWAHAGYAEVNQWTDGEYMVLTSTNGEGDWQPDNFSYVNTSSSIFNEAYFMILPYESENGKPTLGVTAGGLLTLGIDKGEQANYTCIPSFNSTMDSIKWSSDNPGVATVDQSGYITPVSSGSANITAQWCSNNVVQATNSVNVTVTNDPLHIGASRVIGNMGDIVKLNDWVDESDEFGDLYITYSSDNNAVASVDSEGNVSLLSDSPANITAKLMNDTTMLEEKNIQVEIGPSGVTLSLDSTTNPVYDGCTSQMIPTVKAIPGVNFTSSTMKWSIYTDSNTSANGKISSSGVYAPNLQLAKDTSDMIVGKVYNQNGIEVATAEYTIQDKAVLIKLGNIPTSTLQLGDTFKPTMTTTPSPLPNGEKAELTIDNSIVKSQSDGSYLVYSLPNGISSTTTVNANVLSPSGSSVNSDSKTLNIAAIPVQSYMGSIQPWSNGIGIGETKQLTTDATLESGAIQNGYSLQWVSSDPTIVKVDSNGLVTGLKVGTANITLQIVRNGVVEPLPVTRAIVNVTAEVLVMPNYNGKVGSTVQVVATPSTVTSGQSIVYSISDSKIATIDANGNLKFLSNGTAAITAKLMYNGNTIATTTSQAVCSDYEIAIKAPTPGVVPAGQTLSYSATVTPSIPKGYTLVWSVSDSSIGTITQDGKLTLKSGNVGKTLEIIATLMNGTTSVAQDKVSLQLL